MDKPVNTNGEELMAMSGLEALRAMIAGQVRASDDCRDHGFYLG